MIPYDAPMISAILKSVTADILATLTADNFRRSPAQVVIKIDAIQEMLANERKRRTK